MGSERDERTGQRPLTLARPVTGADLAGVLERARKGGTGLTNLPPDRDALARRVAIYDLTGGTVRAAGVRHAVALIKGGTTRLVRDRGQPPAQARP